MAEVFGFEEFASKIERYANQTDNARDALKESGERMRDTARRNFRAGLRQHTGKGASGIEMDFQGDSLEIGWSSRPGLHGYFHELGFHALDNRYGGSRVKRSNDKKRTRIYRRGQATYVPPTPHMRPAFHSEVDYFYKRVQEALKI